MPTPRPRSTTTATTRPEERQSRKLSIDETRVRTWIRASHGILSRVAKECGVSVTFVNRIAYNQGTKSKDLRVEKRLVALGCPLIQTLKR